ncbi:hypothetical protein [Shinella sp.]|uniref:hypothetical protein n=1 Tax=Shinella sp. TaxID=1870904 RepID=UPI003F6F7AF9
MKAVRDNRQQSCRNMQKITGGCMLRCVMAICAALVLSSPTFACSEASVPYCAERHSEFDDEWEFDRCKRDMESYKSEVEEYLTCRNAEAEEAIEEAKRDNEEAIDAYNDAVASFNRRAGR